MPSPRFTLHLVLPAILAVAAAGAVAAPQTSLPLTELATFTGACDASAAVALDADRFVVANDEDYLLRTYRLGTAAPIGQPLDLKPFMHQKDQGGEPDLEGAARIGGRIYWIASHGRNSKAERKPNRLRFFATTVDAAGTLSTTGRPYPELLRDVGKAFPALHLAQASELAPEAKGGLNIEGLAVAPDGKGLLIAFRNPLPGQRAIVVELTNPGALVDPASDPAVVATFAPTPSTLDLDRRGVRSLERRPDGGYLVVAGEPDDVNRFALYTWSGPGATPILKGAVAELRPEAIFVRPNGAVHILSDDGSDACHALPEPQRRFRAARVTIGS